MQATNRPITKKQKQVLDFVQEYTKHNGYFPSLEDIRKHFRLASVSTAHHYIKKLEDLGYLKRTANQARGVTMSAVIPTIKNISTYIPESIKIPLVGAANCGPATIFAEQNIEGYLKVPLSEVNRRSGIFALRAEGNSMNKARVKGKKIESGDFVIVDYQDKSAKNGDYVLSIIDGMANIKKLSIEKGEMKLVSESTEDFKPIYIQSSDNYAINGKIIDVIKK